MADSPFTLLAPGAPQHAPLVVLLGWAGASDGALIKYAQLLCSQGYATVRCVQPTAALFSPLPAPRRRFALALLRFLGQQGFAPPHPLVLYAFSNGGGTVVEQLLALAAEGGEHAGLRDAIVGLAWDSAPGYMHSYMGQRVIEETSPPGLARALRSMGWWATIRVLPFFFGDRKTQYWHVWEALEPSAPQLFLYSLDDPLCDSSKLQQLIALKRKQGQDVTARCWERSQHCTHLRLHPAEYSEALLGWLQRLCVPPRARL